MMMSPVVASTLSSTLSTSGVPADDLAIRQLRHQTKNALQRLMCQIASCRELHATAHGARLLDNLERRIQLSSVVSDALFGVVARPGPLQERLQRLCAATTELMGDEDQLLTVEVAADPACPPAMDEIVLRIAHEFVGNAVKHGLYARSVGRITVRVEAIARTVRLAVLDDGWGFKCAPEPGEGSRIAASLAEQHGGSVGLSRRGGLTVAEAVLLRR